MAGVRCLVQVLAMMDALRSPDFIVPIPSLPPSSLPPSLHACSHHASCRPSSTACPELPQPPSTTSPLPNCPSVRAQTRGRGWEAYGVHSHAWVFAPLLRATTVDAKAHTESTTWELLYPEECAPYT